MTDLEGSVTFLRRGEYAALRDSGRCVGCKGVLLPEWEKRVFCPTCLEGKRIAGSRYARSKKGRRTSRKRQNRYYAIPEKRKRLRERHAARMLERKLSGQCYDCMSPCLEDAPYCAHHREVHLAATRDYNRRRREAKRTGQPMELKPRGRHKRQKSAPVLRLVVPTPKVQPSADPVSDYRDGEISIAEAATRLVELHNGITAQEVGDLLHADAAERNAITNGLKRHAKGGRLSIEGQGMTRVFYPVRQRKAA